MNENLGHYVIIEARNAVEANSIALTLGIYFDGVSKRIDCPCCGDRWKHADDSSEVSEQQRGHKTIIIDGKNLDNFISYAMDVEYAHVYFENGKHIVKKYMPMQLRKKVV